MSKRIINLALACVMLIAAGCEVGPDYRPPQVTVKPSFAESAATTRPGAPGESSTVNSSAALVTQWWKNFNDPQLNSLIDRALQSNLDLQDAESRLRQARAQRGVVGADQYPTANVTGGYQNGRGSKNVIIPPGAFGQGTTVGATPAATPAVVQPFAVAAAAPAVSVSSANAPALNPLGNGGLPGVETELYQAGFDATWELDIFGGVRRSVEAADADTAAALESRRDVYISLVAEVARNYIELRASQRQFNVTSENLRSQQQTLELTRSRYSAGFVTELDVVRQAEQVASTASELPPLESSIHHSIHELSILLAEDPDALAGELTAAAPIPPVPPEVPVGVPAELLRRRPDVRRAERQLAAATARIGVAKADLYPKFSLTGSFGLDSSKAHSLINWDSRYFAINPAVTWPIFDAGKINSNIAVQKELAFQAATDYRRTVLQALEEVEDDLVAYRTEQIRRHALADVVAAAQRAVELARDQYQQGVVDFLTVLDAQRSLFEAQSVLAQSDGRISTDLVALYKALGGGWEPVEASPISPSQKSYNDAHG